MILSVKDVRKSYPGFELNCSLEVDRGRITGLIGQNGAGKTTLFKIILGLVFAEGGEVRMFDENISSLSDETRMRIGSVLADSTFSGYITIKDAGVILKNFYPAFDEAMFLKKCHDLKLNPDKKINELSTGMKAKFKVLCALCRKCDFLILDEPTAGLDVLARDDVLQLLREFMEENEQRSILISSHISSDLETLCDDIYMVHEGRIILHEDTDRLLSDYVIIKTGVKEYETLDKSYLIRRRKESFGYSCLSDHGSYYRQKYPDMVIEKSGIDELIMLMVKGETI